MVKEPSPDKEPRPDEEKPIRILTKDLVPYAASFMTKSRPSDDVVVLSLTCWIVVV